MLVRLLAAHEVVITAIRSAIEHAARNGDGGTHDLLMGDLLRAHEQQVRFLAEHLMDTPLVCDSCRLGSQVMAMAWT